MVAPSRQAALRRIVAGSVENLLATWDDETSLFPYSSRLVSGRPVNDYENALAVRYTLTSLLGLARAARTSAGPEVGEIAARVESFERRQGGRMGNLADVGLAVLLRTELDDAHGANEALKRLGSWDLRSPHLVMQDLAWALWGAVAAHRAGLAGAEDLARLLLSRVTELTSPGGLPFHSARRYRRRIVSFGAVTYYLRALHEAASALEDEDARLSFRAGLEITLALQGPLGDWPWMIDPVSGHALDRYPVFAVHQDSMAMLFLLPGLDRGLPGIEEAIDRSLDWALGRNELEVSMYVDEPVFFAYRSIERRERAARARRYLRSSVNVLTRRSAETLEARTLRLNPECRSYHLGWILYAWCDRIAEAERR